MAPEETSRIMSEGGGFCERHGPFDPPHRTCPFARSKPTSAAPMARRAPPSPAGREPDVNGRGRSRRPPQGRPRHGEARTRRLRKHRSLQRAAARSGAAAGLADRARAARAPWGAAAHQTEPDDRARRRRALGRSAPLARARRFTLERPKTRRRAAGVHLWPFAPPTRYPSTGAPSAARPRCTKTTRLSSETTLFVFKVLTG